MKKLFSDSLRNIRSHWMRSIITLLAVLLTSVLYMTVLSISWHIFSSYELSLMLAGGSDYHGSLSETERLTIPHDEILRKIRQNSLVAEADSLTPLGVYSSDEDSLFSSNLAIFDVDGESALSHLFFSLTEGQFPADGGEVLLLKTLYPDVAIGDKITLYLRRTRDNGFDSYPREFTVSGFFETQTSRDQFSAITHGAAEPDALTEYLIYFKNGVNPMGKLERIADELNAFTGAECDLRPDVNYAYIASNVGKQINFSAIAFFLLSVGVVFFAAFLLIYSVYAVALAQDMKIQGLLWVLGMTAKQRIRAVCAEAGLLWLFSAPMGMLAGYCIGWQILTPIFMSMSGENLPSRFNLWIPLLSALLTLLTLLFSATRPLKNIAKLTPVDAARGTNPTEKESSRRIRRRNTANTRFLGRVSVTRDLRRHLVPALSVALSALLVAMVSALCAMMQESALSRLAATDYQLSIKDRATALQEGAVEASIELGVNIDAGIGFREEYLEAVQSLDSAKSVFPIRTASFSIPATSRQKQTASVELNYWRELGTLEDYLAQAYLSLLSAENGTLVLDVIGIPREYLPSIPLNNPDYLTADDVPEGDFLISLGTYRDDAEPYFHTGELIQCGENGTTYSVIASEGWSWSATSRVLSDLQFYEAGRQLFLLPLDQFEEEFPSSTICGILVNEADGMNGTLRAKLEELNEQFGASAITGPESQYQGYTIRLRSRFDALDGLQNRLEAISIVGYSLSVLLFLIGVLGTINAALASSASRQREFAVFEAVGMTGRQLGQILLEENAFSVLFSAAVLAVSLPLLRFLFSHGFDAAVHVNLVPTIVMLSAQFSVSLAVTWITFRMNQKRTLSERVREDSE